ncbi:hypothetical protein QFZ81_000193 [Paenibacillus sp. V4I9]|nr:hypothetical protein [Paenibacillus sp. V4I9]
MHYTLLFYESSGNVEVALEVDRSINTFLMPNIALILLMRGRHTSRGTRCRGRKRMILIRCTAIGMRLCIRKGRGESTSVACLGRRGATDELYVVFEVDEWVRRESAIVPAGHGIYRILYTTDYMLNRAKEVSELRLDTEEELSDWREKRRVGKVKVTLDREHLDLGSRILGIGLE